MSLATFACTPCGPCEPAPSIPPNHTALMPSCEIVGWPNSVVVAVVFMDQLYRGSSGELGAGL